MNLLRGCRLMIALSLVGVGSGVAVGQTSAGRKVPEWPTAPNLDGLTPEQAAPLQEAYRNEYLGIKKALRDAQLAETKKTGKAPAEPDFFELNRSPRVEVPSNYDWLNEAKESGLSAATLALLQRDGLGIGGPYYKESFEIYTENPQPPFVTSDSLLNGFHVLLEDSLQRLETSRIKELRAVLEESWTSIGPRLTEAKVEPEAVAPFVRHLGEVIGPALRLLGSKISLGDATLEADVDATVAKIGAAEAIELPSWLAPAEPALLALDFRRCKPIGFYAENKRLAAYYRATRWLQMVPLRVSRENELGAAALLADLGGKYENERLKQYISAGERIWGAGDGLSMLALMGHSPKLLRRLGQGREAVAAVLKDERRRVEDHARFREASLNDQLRSPSAARPTQGELELRILPATALPDAVFLRTLNEVRAGKSSWPRGIEVAAWLGSDLAERLAAPPDRRAWDTAVKMGRAMREKAALGPVNLSIPVLYYDCLAELFAAPDPAAPAFMTSEAWQRKSLQTALAGWAQLRRGWELQAKLDVLYLGMMIRPAGFVEPAPEFFARMSRLTGYVEDRLAAEGVFSPMNLDEVSVFEDCVQEIEKLGLPSRDLPWDKMSEEQVMSLDRIWRTVTELKKGVDQDEVSELRDEPARRFWREVVAMLRARIEQLERGENAAVAAGVRDLTGSRLRSRWQELERLSLQLEAMAHKQLRGFEWTKVEGDFLKAYGERLAGIMGYGGNAWLTPKDDAPRWTTVYHDPSVDQQLAVAIGRPRALYVLYPWKGKPILCRGAVMSYYEYPSPQRLTDAEWKALLDSPNAPAQPEWIQPLLAPTVTK